MSHMHVYREIWKLPNLAENPLFVLQQAILRSAPVLISLAEGPPFANGLISVLR